MYKEIQRQILSFSIVKVDTMVESVFKWNSHSILFEGFMVESVFEWNSH